VVEVHLWEKTELCIENICLNQVNLSQVAETVALVLGLGLKDVVVVDARSVSITLDILRAKVNLEQIVGKEKALLTALGSITGVMVTEKTIAHSEGVLGLVNLDEEYATRITESVKKINQGISEAVWFRAIIFPTGEEIIKGNIQDTNTPFLAELLTSAGYRVTQSKPLEDSLDQILSAFRNAADRGYGLVMTTGGVGAEDKDCIVEAVLALDPRAAAPCITHCSCRHGRHKKDGVRIAVGGLDWTTYVALPGPHEEVKLMTPTLLQGLSEQWDTNMLAEKLATVLRETFAPS
jgi:molybdenum cofactor synthesis domain-containing protein